jgi:hypothetical protein
MSATELREMIEIASESAEEQFARRGCVPAVWSAVTAKGEYMIIEPPHRDKDTSMFLLRVLFEIKDVIRCLFIDEAWTARGGEALRQWVEQHGDIHTYPGRIEVIAFLGEDSEGGMINAHRRIIRGAGKPKLGPLEYLEDFTQSEGRLVGMLPRRSTVQ